MTKAFMVGLAMLAGCGFGDNAALRAHRSGCGDGAVDNNESCDDGNVVSGDGCSDTCAVETEHPVCGNGIRESEEACDDGNTQVGDGCSPTCGAEHVCGNGVVELSEGCDDGNVASGDGCSTTCQIEAATACSILPQGGCGGSTPACDIDITATETACREVTKQGTSNSHCAVPTECAIGYTCIEEVDASHPAVCSRFCNDDSDCLGTGSRCTIGLVDNNNGPTNIHVCSNACDPYDQSGCPSGMGCVAIEATGGDYTDCRYMGTKLDGQTCTDTSQCEPGSMCAAFGSSSSHVCAAICKVGSNSCASGSCLGFATPLTIANVQYGLCH